MNKVNSQHTSCEIAMATKHAPERSSQGVREWRARQQGKVYGEGMGPDGAEFLGMQRPRGQGGVGKGGVGKEETDEHTIDRSITGG